MERFNSLMALQLDLGGGVGELEIKLGYNSSYSGCCMEYQKALMNNLVLLDKISPTALQL